MRLGLVSALVASVFTLGGAALAETPPDLDAGRAAMQAALADWAADPDGPGALIQVAVAGEPVMVEAAGLADIEQGRAITPDTRFHIASISKQFTAYAVMRLVTEGRLRLDAPVTTFFPDSEVYADITIQDLLAHTHGVRDPLSLVGASGLRSEDVVTTEQALRLILRQDGVNQPAGERFAYTNSGFVLLSAIVEHVTGEPLSRFVQRTIFEPLGMTHSTYVDSLSTLIPDRALSYVWTGQGYGLQRFNYALTGSTGITTTAADLGIWAEHLDGLREQDPDFYRAFHTLGVLNNGEQTTYAYGQERRVYRGLETWSHGGRDAGYRAFLLRAPDENLSITVLSNAAEFLVADTAYAVLDALLEDDLDREEDGVEAPDADQLAAYAGDYELFPGMVFSLRVRDGALTFAGLGQEEGVAMAAVSDHEFMLNPRQNISLVFEEDEEGAADRFWYQLGYLGRLPAERVHLDAFDPVQIRFSDYEGVYYSAELGAAYEITETENGLVARHPIKGDTALTPYQDDLFSGADVYLGRLAFTRDQSGSVSGFDLSGPLMLGVRFERLP
jgi:CubicO group peptidase (beta-lactamase class C family)